MAVKKKSGGKKGGAAAKGGATKRGGARKSGVTSETAVKESTPRGGAKKSAAPKAAKKAGAAAVKLNDRQRDFLKKIQSAGEPGYRIGPKIEQRTIDALQE